MSKISIPTLFIALLVVLILLTFAFTFQVDFYESAVKVRLGQADERSVIKTPGLRFRWPWPVESITRYDTRLRTLDCPETEIKTLDGKNVIVGSYAIWQVENPLRFYNRARTIAVAEDQMRARISQMQASVVGQRTLPDFVNLDREAVDKSYDELLRALRDGIKDGLASDFGIHLESVGIRRISLPPEVTREVFNSMTQDRKRIAAQYREEGKSRAEAIKAQAESDANQIMSFANRKAEEIRAAGYQASARILAQINESDREFFEWLRWLDTLRASLKQRTTILIDKDWPLFKPFVEPPVTPQQKP